MTEERDAGPGVTLIVRRDRLRRPGHLVPMLVGRLERRGARVAVVDPDSEPVPLQGLHVDQAGLYVLVSPSDAALSLAGVLETRGAALFTPYAAAAGCRDKIVQTAVLSRAGAPVPESWLTVRPEDFADELRAGPLVFKNPRGSRGYGVHVVRLSDDLRRLPAGTPWLVMRYHQPDGPDLKLYRIGDEVHGVSRVFPATTREQKVGRPAAVTPQLRELVLRCGDAFGTPVCGVDVIRSHGRAWVVDMSSFPGFKGVPDAAGRLADVVLERARVHHLKRAS
jgi:ribosomal protein S6--L-glutamate ligase